MSAGAVTHPLFRLLADLEAASIHFTIARDRPDSVRVNVTLAGERVEVDVFEDGHMEVSRFAGSEAVKGGDSVIRALIARQSAIPNLQSER